MTPEEAFLQTIHTHLDGEYAPEETEARILEFGKQVPQLAPERVAEIAREFRHRRELLQSATSRTLEFPRLLVDWGEGIYVGGKACPEFHVISPESYRGRPAVEIVPDVHLDFDPQVRCPELVDLGDDRHWIFDAPFCLTTGGEDCRPGTYRLELRFRFSQAGPILPRYFRTKIRLTVKSAEALAPKTLEIHGDGDALLNLHGRDLSDFGNIIMKCSDRGVINVQSLDLPLPAQASPPPKPADERAPRQHEYELRPDHERDQGVPRASHRFVERDRAERAALVWPDDRRLLLLARSPVNLGRDRTNDIALRHLPPGPENNEHSLNISRQHLRIRLEEDAVVVEDLRSSKRTLLDGSELAAPRRLGSDDCGKPFPLRLAAAADVAVPLEMSLRLFAAGAGDCGATAADLLEALDVGPPPLWQSAEQVRLAAVRLDRCDNLREESYLLMYHPITIGCSPNCAIEVHGPGVAAMHGRLFHLAGCFWFENLASIGQTQLAGTPLPRKELAPLVPGSMLQLGEVALRWEPWRQLHL